MARLTQGNRGTRIIYNSNSGVTIETIPTQRIKSRITIPVISGILLFLIIGFLLGFFRWIGMEIFSGINLRDLNDYNGNYESHSLFTYVLDSILLLLYWISIPFRFIIEMLRIGLGMIADIIFVT